MAAKPVGCGALFSSSTDAEVGYWFDFYSSWASWAGGSCCASSSGLLWGFWSGSDWVSGCDGASTTVSGTDSFFCSSTSDSGRGSAFYRSTSTVCSAGSVAPEEAAGADPTLASSYSSSTVNLSTSCWISSALSKSSAAQASSISLSCWRSNCFILSISPYISLALFPSNFEPASA